MTGSTVADVISKARTHLMDTTAVSGNVMTDNQYLPHVNDALLEIIQNVRGLEHFRVVRDGYVVIPSFTNAVQVDTLTNFPDFGVGLQYWERKEDTSLTIVGSWAGAGGSWTLQVSSTAGLVRGQNFMLYGSSDPHLAGSWAISNITDATHFQFVGNNTYKTGTPAGGAVSFASLAWNPVDLLDYITDYPQTPVSGICWVAWVNGVLQFPTQSSNRQFRIRYLTGSSQVAATTDILDIPEALSTLAMITAIMAGNSIGGAGDRLMELSKKVYGDPSLQTPGSLKLLRRHYSLQRQAQQIVRPLWRPRSAPVYGTLVRT